METVKLIIKDINDTCIHNVKVIYIRVLLTIVLVNELKEDSIYCGDDGRL